MTLGRTITRPLRRDRKNDFANAQDAELVAASVAQILGTISETGRTRGELPWRTEFGSGLSLLVHRNPDRTFEELANVYVLEALQRWEPRVIVRGATVSSEIVDGDTVATLRVVYDVTETPRGATIASGLVSTVTL